MHYCNNNDDISLENSERPFSYCICGVKFHTYVKIAACNSGILSLSSILDGLKMLFSSVCRTCRSVVHGTSTKIYERNIVIKNKNLYNCICKYKFYKFFKSTEYYLIIYILFVDYSRVSLRHEQFVFPLADTS